MLSEGKEDEEITDAEKVDAEHKEINQEVASAQVQDEVHTTTIIALTTQKEKTDVLPSSSSLSISSNYGSIFLNLDNITSAETKIISMLDVQVQQEIPSIQSSSLLILPILVIPEPIVIKPPEIVTATPTTTIPPFTPPLRVIDLEKEVKELKQFDLLTTLRASIRYEVPLVVNEYLGSSLGDALQKEL
ncbi:hypothetical protein Tco_0621970 [Tanacetum coccineum]